MDSEEASWKDSKLTTKSSSAIVRRLADLSYVLEDVTHGARRSTRRSTSRSSPTLRADDENARRDVVVADGTDRRLVAAAGAGHNVAAVEEDARSGQLPAQEADVAVAEELHLKLWHLEEKCGKGAASTKGTSRGRRTRIWNTAGTTYRQTRCWLRQPVGVGGGSRGRST